MSITIYAADIRNMFCMEGLVLHVHTLKNHNRLIFYINCADICAYIRTFTMLQMQKKTTERSEKYIFSLYIGVSIVITGPVTSCLVYSVSKFFFLFFSASKFYFDTEKNKKKRKLPHLDLFFHGHRSLSMFSWIVAPWAATIAIRNWFFDFCSKLPFLCKEVRTSFMTVLNVFSEPVLYTHYVRRGR